MKFVHIADLHLGKTVFQRELLTYQKQALDNILDYMLMKEIKVLVIAGDVYDRQVPGIGAINLLNDFLDKAINNYHFKILMISGNHDSADRLNFGSQLLDKQGLYIVSNINKQMDVVEIEGVNFYLLPFFKPAQIRYLFSEEVNSYHEAMAVYLQHQKLDYSKPRVLVTHQFVAGDSASITSESETLLSVGGTEIIGADLFRDFNYVALGHLHAPQQIQRPEIRYSGSLMKYSFDEAKHKKGLAEVEIKEDTVKVKIVEMPIPIDFKVFKDKYENLLEYPVTDDFTAIELNEDHLIYDAANQLRNNFPNLLQITYPQLIKTGSNIQTRASQNFEKMTPFELFKEFYSKMKDQELSVEGADIIQKILEEDQKDVT